MLFWFVAALLTLGASLAVLLPMTSLASPVSAKGAHDLEVYRDQLAELDRDAARGLIEPSEADHARAEIARRILKADSEASALEATAPARGVSGRGVSAAAVLAVPLISWGVYIAIGSPDLPSQPLAGRLAKNPADSTVDELVARAEAHLAANPSEGRGWDVLAPIYLRVGRFEEAVNAYRNAILLEGATSVRQAGLGEAIAAVAGGLVTSEARAAFERALELEPGQPKATFYMATALAQEGRLVDAVAAWKKLLAALPAGSAWRDAAQQAIAEAESRIAAGRDLKVAPGPSEEQIEAAAGMSDADRTAMIEKMVAGLDEKLRQNPHDLDGWTRLVRSYVVLGRVDAARDAMKRGTEALGNGSLEARKLAAFSVTLGLAATD